MHLIMFPNKQTRALLNPLTAMIADGWGLIRTPARTEVAAMTTHILMLHGAFILLVSQQS